MSTPGADTSGEAKRQGRRARGGEARQLSADRRRADRDRRRRRSGRRDRAASEGLEVVSGGDRRDDAGRGGAVDGANDEVAARWDLRLADREVDHVHAVLHGSFDRCGDLGRVPRPGRRWTRSGLSGRGSCRGRPAARRRRASRARRRGSASRGCRPRCRRRGRVVRFVRVVWQLRVTGPRRGEERPGDDHLCGREGDLALRKPGGIA